MAAGGSRWRLRLSNGPANGAGLDPGAIPPVPAGFTGELKCVQVMADGTPIGANSLIGEATLDSTDGSR